ncbi:hypothetical protein Fmac_029596 [Flemingia macrophylla]|uniref:TFIIS N-terminal domain-containing protein n=1 Tax=Flemingia macrophylla TaxID=520843 RepID=A0ABD1LAS2_9FABA
MRMKSRSLDDWRNYFGSANSNIFEIIEHAIIVAATDCPKEFRVRRDGIAERLFSSRLTRCLGCDRVELAVPVAGDAKEKEEEEEDDNDDDGDDDDDDDDGHDDVVEFQREEAGASKESKVNGGGDLDGNHVSNYSFGEAEELTDLIEEESQYFGEILRIKDILQNSEDESESVLFDSLRRLQLIQITVDSLKATEIGKAVNPLRKHGSKDIRHLARTLIDGWKEMVDEWVKATAIPGSEGTPDSVNPSVVDDDDANDEEDDDDGLPSIPMDDGAFFVTQGGSMELSEFFDGMDDDGNPQPSKQVNKDRENGRRLASDGQIREKRKLQASHVTDITTREVRSQQPKKNEAAVRLNKPVSADSGPVRPPKSNMQRKSNMEPKMQQQKIENNSITRRPPSCQLDKDMNSDDAAVQVKLEATKRKLQESYQQVENAKKQRTIQVMEINDLPKQAVRKNPYFKPGYHNRQWANARR